VKPLFDGRGRFVAGLSAAQRWVCATTVEAFAEKGRGPSRHELLAAGTFSEDELAAALDHLDERDMLVVGDERVLALYPFSDRPGQHRVRVGGKRLYAM
jgi:hypothetical protein